MISGCHQAVTQPGLKNGKKRKEEEEGREGGKEEGRMEGGEKERKEIDTMDSIF